MMFWTRMQAIGLAGLMLAALTVGGRAGMVPRGPELPDPPRQAPPRQAPPGPAPLPPAAAIPAPPGPARAAIVAPFPPRDELHRLLRHAAGEAIELARVDPKAGSWALTALGEAQARAGDRAGAHDTLEAAVQGANVIENGRPSGRYFARVARVQRDAGLKDEARATLWRELAMLPATAADEPETDGRTVGMLAEITREQARTGQPAEARATADRLLRFVAEFLASGREAGSGTAAGTAPSVPRAPMPAAPPGFPAPPQPRPDARPELAPAVAATLAAVGDFDGSFRWSEGLPFVGDVLGGVALTAAQCLDREAARPFVVEAAARMARLGTVEETYHGLSDLAEAQALIGDVEAARRSARSIGVGPTKVNYDMTDGQPFALYRVARVQREAGDVAGAAETARDGLLSVRDQPKMRFTEDRYGQVAAVQIQLGDLADALRSVEAMKANRAEPLARVARMQAAAGQAAAAHATFDRAIAEAAEAAPDPTRPLPGPPRPAERYQAGFARAALAEVRAMAGDVAGALEVVRGIDDPPFRLSAMTKVAAARAMAGDVAGALRLALDEAKSPAERRIALQGLGEGVTARLTTPALDPGAAR